MKRYQLVIVERQPRREGGGTVDLAALIADPNCENTHTAPHADEYGEQMDELRLLRALVEEIDNTAGDSARDGVGLIRDSYFEQHARDEAEELTEMAQYASNWPFNCIDWSAAADALKQDYSSIDYDGVEYWVRS